MSVRSLLMPLALALSTACASDDVMLAQPTAASELSFSVSARVMGQGLAGPHGAGVALDVVSATAVSATARLEVGFSDGSTPLGISFEPEALSLRGVGRGTLTASVPDAADPRLQGRKVTTLKAAVTVREASGAERTALLTLTP